jgi:hypothetical protein
MFSIEIVLSKLLKAIGSPIKNEINKIRSAICAGRNKLKNERMICPIQFGTGIELKI